jgi:murein DD-endopeptidase MepM/ murein hydrolase activator NlpD
MNTKSFFVNIAFASTFSVLAQASPIGQISEPAGKFEVPVSVSQTGPLCSTSGSKLDQYHMQWNTEFSKYHMGEDLNGKCGGSTDSGYPLRAIADGTVVYLDDIGSSKKGKQLHIRYSFPYAPALGDVQTFDTVYLHINGVNSSKVWWFGPGTGSSPKKGDVVAYLGGTGGWLPHLHWEMRWDNDPNLLTVNEYQNPLVKTHALKFRAPSLVVDDRRNELVYTVSTPGTFKVFTMSGNAPSSTAYMMRGGKRKSLKKAIEAGWISESHMLIEGGGVWNYYYDIDNVFFENGRRYAITSYVSGVSLNIPVPRNSYQSDRARLDMILSVNGNSKFSDIKTETYGSESPWSGNSAWNIHWMQFKLSDGRTTYLNQVTNRVNPLIRNTCYYDPDLKKWTDWKLVGWNNLY